jgi:putative intracellular protease/amidase
MRWFLRRLDGLVAAVCAALGGLAGAQLPVFIQQYRQRLAGHLAEAERSLREVLEGASHNGLTAEARDQLAAIAAARVDALARSHDMLARGDDMSRPLTWLRQADWDIARATLADFTPALQLNTAGAVYGFAGLVLGWLAWELVKAPLRPLLFRRRPGQIRESR